MSSPQGPIRVLHVDDDASFAEIAAEFLERAEERFEVDTETSAADGLAALADGAYDCVVSDYQMPGRDGLEFLGEVRRDHPDLPFILFTGQGSEEIASEAISAGVTDYIQKETGSGQYTVLANRVANAVERDRAVRRTDLSRRAMETAREGLSLVEADGTFSYANSAFAELFGYDPQELVGEEWTVLYHEDEAERLANDILPAVRETGYWSGETVRLTRDGERLVTDHRLADTDEDVIICTAQDLTDERLAAGQGTDEFDRLVDAMTGYAFYTLDHEGYVTRWNEGAVRLLGYETETILGEHVGTVFPPPAREQDLPSDLLDTASAAGSVTQEGWRHRADGSRIWTEATITSRYDETGTLRGFAEILRETTEPMAQA
jgi:PAS domain S-box-containing protein